MDFGTKIKSAREDLDMSQQQIAQQIPMNQSNYSKIERNLQEPNMYQLKRIVEILHLDVYDLLDLKHCRPTNTKAQQFRDGVLELYRKLYPDG